MPKYVESTELMDLEPYGSLMSLLEICKQYIPNYEGLTHAHFLYVLLKPEFLNCYMKDYKQEEMKEYFEKLYVPNFFNKNKKHRRFKSLEDFYKSDRFSLSVWQLEKGCIKRPQRLNEKLNVLIKIGWIKAKGEKKHRVYYSTDQFIRFIKKSIINWHIERFSSDQLNKLYEETLKI